MPLRFASPRLILLLLLLLALLGGGWYGFSLDAESQPVPIERNGLKPAEETACRLRLLSFNMAHASGDGWSQWWRSAEYLQRQLEGIASVLQNAAADVVAVQESDQRAFWTAHVDQGAYLAQQAGYGFVARGLHVNAPWADLQYGVALLSRRPLSAGLSVRFAPSPPSFPKGFVVARLPCADAPGGAVDAVSLHLDFLNPWVRRAQLRVLIDTLRQRGRPLLVMGDFNSAWDDAESAPRQLAEALDLHTWQAQRQDAALVSFPFTGRRIDWILVSREFAFVDYRVIAEDWSDHRAVVADIVLDVAAGQDVAQTAR